VPDPVLQPESASPQPEQDLNICIGHLTEIRGDGMEASLLPLKTENALVTIGEHDVLIGQLGSYVSIRQGDIRILALIF